MAARRGGRFGGRPVYVDVLLNGAGHAMGTVRTGLNGCVTWPLVNGYTYRFRVYHREARCWWIGRTGWQYSAPGRNYSFGTVYLQTSCY
jgi:hypothetical protein